MRLRSYVSLLFIFGTPTLARATSVQDKLQNIVVQIRVDTDTVKDGCGVGILIARDTILTAAHVVKGAHKVRILSQPQSGSPAREYAVPTDAHTELPDDPTAWDVALIKLSDSWPGWNDDFKPSLTALRDTDVGSARFAVYAYHRKGECKGSHQAAEQDFHSVTVSVVSGRYKYPTDLQTRIRVTPALDEGYSGSPLILAPCGKREACVVGVDSQMTNDGEAQATFAVGFDDEAGAFLEGHMIDVDRYVDVRAASDGLFFSFGLAADVNAGGLVHGAGSGLTGTLGYSHGLDTINDIAIGGALSVTDEFWNTHGGYSSSISSPDGSVSVPTSPQSISNSLRFDIDLVGELRRTRRLSLRPELGFALVVDSVSDSDSATGVGLGAGMGARLPLGRLWIDIALKLHGWSYIINRPQYTVVPGTIEPGSGTARGLSVGLVLMPVYW